MPETSFTRTISNPEVVMKRRRQQKLEKRMQEFMSSDGRPDSGKSHHPGLLSSHFDICLRETQRSGPFRRIYRADGDTARPHLPRSSS